MAVSSNSLFHYTAKFDSLKSILKKGFLLSYCMEADMAIPMVSFCDNPLSQAKYFLDNYGNYAIGMNIDWAIKNKLNPVVYLEKNSYLTKTHRNALVATNILNEFSADHRDSKQKQQNFTKANNLRSFPVEIGRFSKPYRGTLERNGSLIENYKFYDEREWRYIPDIDEHYFELGLTKENYKKFKRENPIKPHFKENGLKFKANDIKYIIIKKKSEVPELIDHLMNIENLGSPKVMQLLITRILLAEQIIEDV